ncbi:hypothetical protein VTO42DRAFT_1535 [Malbranchea cinnamomea]
MLVLTRGRSQEGAIVRASLAYIEGFHENFNETAVGSSFFPSTVDSAEDITADVVTLKSSNPVHDAVYLQARIVALTGIVLQ